MANIEKPKVLLVDDNRESLICLENMSQDKSFDLDIETVHASSGNQALKCALEQEFALMLLDVQMPGMDGFELAVTLRQHKKTKAVPIIFVTAFDHDEANVFKGYETGAVDFIFKPLQAIILKSKVKFFLDLHMKTQELKIALSRQKSLTGWGDGSITAQTFGVGPLRERAAGVFADVKKHYKSLLVTYLEALGFNIPPPRDEINAMARKLGDLSAGPRDVVDLHITAVEEKSENVSAKRAMVFATEGRFLALELMGYLVDYYRLGNSSVVFKGGNRQGKGE